MNSKQNSYLKNCTKEEFFLRAWRGLERSVRPIKKDEIIIDAQESQIVFRSVSDLMTKKEWQQKISSKS